MSELSQLGRGQDAAKQPTVFRTPPVTKNYVAAKVKSTKVEGIPSGSGLKIHLLSVEAPV